MKERRDVETGIVSHPSKIYRNGTTRDSSRSCSSLIEPSFFGGERLTNWRLPYEELIEQRGKRVAFRLNGYSRARRYERPHIEFWDPYRILASFERAKEFSPFEWHCCDFNRYLIRERIANPYAPMQYDSQRRLSLITTRE